MAIADDVWHGRTAPFSARATAAAKETTKVLKIESGTSPLDQAKVALPTSHPVEAKETLQESPGLYERERERERAAIWFFWKFGSIVFWEVGYVSLFRDSRMSYTDI